MSRCIACNIIMSDQELHIDEELCKLCLKHVPVISQEGTDLLFNEADPESGYYMDYDD